jgi:hypothetical protein
MHKKKNREKVLAGEMILTFVKDGRGKLPHQRASAAPTIEELIDDALAQVTPDGAPFPGELLFNHVVLRAWSRGALHSLDLTRETFAEILKSKGWQYNTIRNQWVSTVSAVPSNYQLTF